MVRSVSLIMFHKNCLTNIVERGLFLVGVVNVILPKVKPTRKIVENVYFSI